MAGLTCPACSLEVETTIKALGEWREPKPDVSWFICSECGFISRYCLTDGKLSIRIALADELADIGAGEREMICALRASILQLNNTSNPTETNP